MHVFLLGTKHVLRGHAEVLGKPAILLVSRLDDIQVKLMLVARALLDHRVDDVIVIHKAVVGLWVPSSDVLSHDPIDIAEVDACRVVLCQQLGAPYVVLKG